MKVSRGISAKMTSPSAPAIRNFGPESSVRPSLAFYNTRKEVDALVLALRSLKRN